MVWMPLAKFWPQTSWTRVACGSLDQYQSRWNDSRRLANSSASSRRVGRAPIWLAAQSAAVGQLGVMAINLALGGTYENLDPAIKFFKELQKNQPIVPKQTSYARVISGEIPILLDYDFNAYRGMYKDNAPVAFVIPKEGSVVQPYVMGLAKNAPHAENGKKVLDFVLSDESQTMWGNAFLRPVFADKMSAEAKKKFLPDADYARAKPVDLKKLGAAQNMIVERFKNEVK